MSRRSPPPLAAADPAAWIATWFGAGLLPRAPGTWGSLAALPFAWLIHAHWGQAWLGAGAALLFAVGVWAAERYRRRGDLPEAQEDPQTVVVDEVVGQWLVLAVLPAPELLPYAIGFALFRLFDVWKPWPVSWADRHVKGGLGIMLDDALAAAYGAAALFLCHRFLLN